jgi:formamidase
VTEGELFRVETIDWTGGQIKDNDDASDVKARALRRASRRVPGILAPRVPDRIRASSYSSSSQNVDLTCCHHLSGPIRVTDSAGVAAKPGDLLVVEICDLGPLPGDEWGYTGTFDRNNGGGFLTDHFPCASKAIWQFDGVYASSRHIPGVRFAGIIHPGLIGTAPSQELLDMWNAREGQLCKDGGSSQLASVLHTRPLALLPEPKGAVLGGIPENSALWAKVAGEAARTIPGRENGGNCDIKNLSRGCRVYLPCFVEGANLSMGDMHFSQGDGEVSFCGAIEMSGFLTLKCDIIRGGMATYLTPMGPTPLHVHPIFESALLCLPSHPGILCPPCAHPSLLSWPPGAALQRVPGV